MRSCVLLCFIVAVDLRVAMDVPGVHSDDLFIKMPMDTLAAASQQSVAQKAGDRVTDVLQGAKLDMQEEQQLHSTYPNRINSGKLHKVINFMRSVEDRYENASEDQKKAFQAQSQSLIMMGASTRGYNAVLCQMLWSSTTDLAARLSWQYCPSVTFNSDEMEFNADFHKFAKFSPSRWRSATLSSIFFKEILSSNRGDNQYFFDSNVCYLTGASVVCGASSVDLLLSRLGWPAEADIGHVSHWYCDSSSCLVPLKAWGGVTNYCLAAFSSQGGVSEVIIPKQLWR
jgi:hypothetical protein